MTRFLGPEPLDQEHQVEGFESGEGALDVWLARYARTATGVGSARTYVVSDAEQDGRVIGYHALAVASVKQEEVTERAAKGMGRHPVPAVLLARLAVDRSVQERGVGTLLMQDAMLRTVAVSKVVGVRLLLAHALGDAVRAFYLKFGFEQSPSDRKNLQIVLKDIQASLRAVSAR
jgi:GNAT superfamily N-acetyltransferase